MAFILVFIATSIILTVSLQLLVAPVESRYLGQSSQASQAAYELSLIGLNAVESDIRTRLDAGQTLDTSYTYPPTSVTMPEDPDNLPVSNSAVGTYSAVISKARGYTYQVKVTATANGATVVSYRLLQMTPQTFDCATIETQIFNGNIASLSNSDLISYAQNNCMLKTASVTVTSPNSGNGSSGCGTYNGSGALNLGTNNCGTITANGTYNTIQYKSPTSTSGGGMVLYSYPAAGFSGTRTIHIPGAIDSYDQFFAQNSGGSKSSFPHTFLFASPALSGSFEVKGGTGNDTFSFNGSSTADIYTSGGNNTVIINGTWGNAAWDSNYMELGDSGSTGTNTLYINSINGGAHEVNIATLSSGATQLYLNNLAGGTVNFYGGSGNDIIGCGVSFTGGAGTCGFTLAGTYTFEGTGGSDIISLDLMLPSGANINGNTGSSSETSANIIYTRGCSGSTNIRTNNTKSLVISGGNRSSGCAINGSGGNSVLLKKSGTTDSGTNSNFARTLTY